MPHDGAFTAGTRTIKLSAEEGLREKHSIRNTFFAKWLQGKGYGLKTLSGTAKLLKNSDMNFEEVVSRVATKDGITEVGARVIRSGLPALFDDVFRSTPGKHAERKAEIGRQFRDRRLGGYHGA